MTKRLLVEAFPDAKKRAELEKSLEKLRSKLNGEEQKFIEDEVAKIKDNLKQQVIQAFNLQKKLLTQRSQLKEEEWATVEKNYAAKTSKFSQNQKAELEGLIEILKKELTTKEEKAKKEAADRYARVININKCIIQEKVTDQQLQNLENFMPKLTEEEKTRAQAEIQKFREEHEAKQKQESEKRVQIGFRLTKLLFLGQANEKQKEELEKAYKSLSEQEKETVSKLMEEFRTSYIQQKINTAVQITKLLYKNKANEQQKHNLTNILTELNQEQKDQVEAQLQAFKKEEEEQAKAKKKAQEEAAAKKKAEAEAAAKKKAEEAAVAKKKA